MLKNRGRSRNEQEIPPDLNDLGIGSRVSRDTKVRLINKDGSYNIRREGLNFFRRLCILFHSALPERGTPGEFPGAALARALYPPAALP